jgi:hypothetical protein
MTMDDAAGFGEVVLHAPLLASCSHIVRAS